MKHCVRNLKIAEKNQPPEFVVDSNENMMID